jgi:cyclopropane-fatty-acyl-phospholipid synthase
VIETVPVARDEHARHSLAILRTIFGRRFVRGFSIELWDGTVVPSVGTSAFTLRLTVPYALRAALMPPLDLNPGRAYVEKWLDIDGDLENAIEVLERSVMAFPKFRLPLILARLMRLPKPPAVDADGTSLLRGRVHSRRRDAAAIGFHYDQPLTFYRSFLDERMVYSCAYWDDGVADLGAAQVAKLDYTLRKLRLQAGERILDIGCGWGALAIRAAQRFGAYALGITLSRRQHEEAQRRIADAGVEDRVRVELRDYRDLGNERFDKVVSVGMVEHVGRERLGTYFEAAWNALREGGLFLNHGIQSQTPSGDGYRADGFIKRYVFPDGDLTNLDQALRTAEATGFEIRDVENLREHYARTLRAWTANLDANRDEVIAATDERTYRIWRMYMTGSARNFSNGQMGLFQTLLAKPDAAGVSTVPATRRDLYA